MLLIYIGWIGIGIVMMYDPDNKAIVHNDMKAPIDSSIDSKLRKICRRQKYKKRSLSELKRSGGTLKYRLSDKQYRNWKVKLVLAAIYKKRIFIYFLMVGRVSHAS